MAAPHRRGFPVLLYAGLLVASVGLLRPASWAPIERGLGTLQTLPLRLLGTEALAATSRTSTTASDSPRTRVAGPRRAARRPCAPAKRSRQAPTKTSPWRVALRARCRRPSSRVSAREIRAWGLELDVRSPTIRAPSSRRSSPSTTVWSGSSSPVAERGPRRRAPERKRSACGCCTPTDRSRARTTRLWPGRVEPVRRVGAVAGPRSSRLGRRAGGCGGAAALPRRTGRIDRPLAAALHAARRSVPRRARSRRGSTGRPDGVVRPRSARLRALGAEARAPARVGIPAAR
jgi:hypothetical protein